MMTAVMRRLPARRLAAGGPLPRHVPVPDQFGLGRVLQVEDAHDVADIAFERRRAVEIAAVEREAVHAGADRLPARDRLRLRRIAHVVNAKAAAPVGRWRAGLLMV